jgi:hypothetical protein
MNNCPKNSSAERKTKTERSGNLLTETGYTSTEGRRWCRASSFFKLEGEKHEGTLVVRFSVFDREQTKRHDALNKFGTFGKASQAEAFACYEYSMCRSSWKEKGSHMKSIRLIRQAPLNGLIKGTVVVMLILLCVMTIEVQAIYAKGQSGGPNAGQAACLEPGLSTFIVGPNEITGNADITNGCPANVSGSANIESKITDCPGVGSSDKNASFTFQLSPNKTDSQGFDVKAGCVVCVNHKPSSFPPFHVQIIVSNITGTFVYNGTIYHTGATPSSVSVTDLLGNNPPEVIPPCP